jgi:hypothetical protein
MAIADFDSNKILVVNRLQNQNILVWHEEGKETEMWLAKEKFPQFDLISFMDITKDKKFGILGGVVGPDVVIALFTFDTAMQIIA